METKNTIGTYKTYSIYQKFFYYLCLLYYSTGKH